MGRVTDIDRLYAVPLEDFVAERKQVAKELRDAGDRAAAAEVAKLPKPTPPAWALNRLARDEPDAVGEWLEAAAALREASANPGAGLREAMAEHRDATRRLLAAARDRTRPAGRPLSEPMLERVRELLQEATADPERAEALRRGTVVEGGELPAGEVGEATEGGERRTRTAAGEGGEAADRGSTPARGRAAAQRAAQEREAEQEAERKAKERAERLAELERHVKATEDELARLRDEAAEREAAAADADEHLEDARRTLHRTESEASAAHAAADDARAAAETAERELRQLTRQLRNASS
jgi:DNA repair exonuclease SbcCD ATPase subunit